MKNLVLSVSFLFALVVSSFAQIPAESTPDGAEITFETTTIDYGKIERNSDRQRIFKFTNTGSEPLIITHAKGSCGCTVPTWPKEPIMPGETGEIKVNYDTNRVGVFRKTVTLTTNAASSQSVVLNIKGEVYDPAAGGTSK